MKPAVVVTGWRNGRHPSCAEANQFRLWIAAMKKCSERPWQAGFCEDCTPEFAEKHRALGTCERPFIKFRVDKDGFVEGYYAP